MTLYEDGKKYSVRPLGWDKKGIKGAYTRFATTEYIIFDDGNAISTVKYDGLKQSIIIKKNGKIWKTKHFWFKPDELAYKGRIYQLHEKLSGALIITHDELVVSEGKYWKPIDAPEADKVEHEQLTVHDAYGKSTILTVEKIVDAKGKGGTKRGFFMVTVKFFKYQGEITEILKELAVGYCIKILLLLMFI
jgi:hypothetical protein